MLGSRVVMSHMHNVCSYVGPSTGLHLPPLVGMEVAGLGHFICNPPAWILHRVWPSPGLRAGLTGGCCWNLRLGPTCQRMALLEAVGEGE